MSTQITFTFDVPDELYATRGALTILYDLLRCRRPLKMGDQFEIVKIGDVPNVITLVDVSEARG